MSNDGEVRQALGQLIGALRDSRGWRVTARPGRVVVDHAEGPRVLELSWTSENQTAALAALARGGTIVDGLAIMAVGDAVLVVRGPDANRRLEDVARDGVISGLAGRLIEAAVALGRNVIVAGPWLASVDLIGAIVAGGTRPAILGGGQVPLPATWVRVNGHQELAAYGADRVGTWSTEVDALTKLMAGASGVIGWVDARRLDRVLVRYEAATDPGAQAPLQVVAGVDLVVVMQGVGGVKVREVAEIAMAADGYRPQLLFATGMPPSPQALVPLAAPTFIDELAAHGFGVLADELKAVAPPQRTVPDDYARTVDRARQVAAQIDLHEAEELPEPRRRPTPSGRQHDPLGIREALRPQGRADIRPPDLTSPEIPSAIVEALKHAPPPGWELDRLGEDEWVDENGSSGNAEDAAMAATFGLAPPPRPAGFKGEAVSFSELLKRAKDRDGGSSAEDDNAFPPTPPDDT